MMLDQRFSGLMTGHFIYRQEVTRADKTKLVKIISFDSKYEQDVRHVQSFMKFIAKDGLFLVNRCVFFWITEFILDEIFYKQLCLF